MKTRRASSRELDKIDRHILRLLQEEGRMSYVDLGERVGLSTTPCMERVKRLERENSFSDMARGSTRRNWRPVCWCLSRSACHPSRRKLLGDILLKLPGVRESKSYIVMEEIKESLAIPVPESD